MHIAFPDSKVKLVEELSNRMYLESCELQVELYEINVDCGWL